MSNGRFIRLKRISLNLNQAELAQLTGFSQNYISLIERFKRKPVGSMKKIYNTLKDLEKQVKKFRNKRNNIIKIIKDF